MNGDRNNSKRPTAVSESGNHLIVSASISDTACSMFDCRSAGSETPVSYYLTCQPNFVAIEGQLSRWLSDYILRTPVNILRFRIVWRAAPAVFKLLEESQRAGRNVMPQNGETNQEFGLCKTLCCGNEIIVREGGLFPDCPNHLGLTTIWKAIVDDSRRGNRS